ncbi:hypothetical protein K469DRAFT_705153 [Zopfia rhizophila CBS 207.26]|uniref:Uncharacterized protein n=1 Tax=Zopfia rhizophila CBS 207.26 TaxID=1314779 RepID=A0A6A6E8L0_9PEZI|nr:hypothetical protein K469DRAFT_705153 [Zopfia rhizophila CBS 207.26]
MDMPPPFLALPLELRNRIYDFNTLYAPDPTPAPLQGTSSIISFTGKFYNEI